MASRTAAQTLVAAGYVAAVDVLEEWPYRGLRLAGLASLGVSVLQVDGFGFEIADVPVETTRRVDESLQAGRSAWVHGRWGTGKTHAVRQTITAKRPDAIWLDLGVGPMQQPRFMVDLARQTANGRDILRAFAGGHITDALQLAERGVNGHALIIDRAERLIPSRATEWEEPAEGIWSSASAEVRQWLVKRAEQAPVVFIGERRLVDEPGIVGVEHQSPSVWPFKLQESPVGRLDWRELAKTHLHNRPGGLQLAMALVPFLDQSQYDALLEDLRWEANEPTAALRIVGQKLGQTMPAQWRQALMVIRALDGFPEHWIHAALDEPELSQALDSLQVVRLVNARDGRLSVLPSAIKAGVFTAFDAAEARPLLVRAARLLCESVNALDTFDPIDAERVFRAHMLYVQLGEWDEAARTARLHVGGLVELARRKSIGDRFDEARQLYGRIEAMLSPMTPHTDESMRRLHSYAMHYRAYNARKAGIAPAGEVLDAYREATSLWPENALWHQRLISQSFELGRLTEAQEAVQLAYDQVPAHPRRDTFLRIAPAWSALEAGVGGAGLSLIEPILASGELSDPDGVARLGELLKRWERGVDVRLLTRTNGCLVFNHPTLVRVARSGERWRALISGANVDGRAAGPGAAITRAADALAAKALWLLRSPTWQLDEGDLRRKSAFIGLLDLLNSDIGLSFESHRWLAGHVRGGRFVPVQDMGVECIELMPGLGPLPDEETRTGLYLGRVPVLRDGQPSGRVEVLEPVGSGRSLDELLAEVRRIGGSDA